MLIGAVSGPWAVLQSFAWVGMVVSYSRDNSIEDAISMTFDGEHPCKMCKIVKDGRGAEQKPSSRAVSDTKIDFFLEAGFSRVISPSVYERDGEFIFGLPFRPEPPLLRPPIPA